MVELLLVEDLPTPTRVCHFFHDVGSCAVSLAIGIRKSDKHLVLVLSYDTELHVEELEGRLW